VYISSGSRILWSPNSCHFESHQLNVFGITPMFDSLQDWGLCLLTLLLPSVTPPLIVSRPVQECVRKVDILNLTKNHDFPFKSQIVASSCFQWSMQDLGCLVNITNFEFLCRKLHFVHAGIVQNVIVFIKSARHFRKTISLLASQRVACIPGMLRPMAMHFWIWELTMMWRDMHGWQTWSRR
jgi:hypothetical protein